MKFCSRCVMPTTRPGTIIGDDGVCQACKNYDARMTVDWVARRKELEVLCDKHRRDDGYYDCVIPVSGGKDSHFLTYMMKEEMGMNPLLVCVADPFTHTEAGAHNLRNLGETFGCDTTVFSLSVDLFRRVTRIGFEELGEPLRFIEAVIYTAPPRHAAAFGIPLVVYGENAAYTYGAAGEDGCCAGKYIAAGHSASGDSLGGKITDFWSERGIPLREMNAIVPPSREEIGRTGLEAVFMSYFVPWDDERNYERARRYGFRDLRHEWRREGWIEDYSQIDSVAYLVHSWMKYPKFGFARATDIASRWVRKGAIDREEAKELVKEHDHRLDQLSLRDFCDFAGYTPRQFWDVVEKFWNRELFESTDGLWRPRSAVYMA